MKKIVLKQILGDELLTRRSANKIISIIDAYDTLDFDEITFMSRSFADEICNIIEKKTNITLINMCPQVKALFDIVKESRNKPRNITSSDAKVLTFEDMASLSAFLSNLR